MARRMVQYNHTIMYMAKRLKKAFGEDYCLFLTVRKVFYFLSFFEYGNRLNSIVKDPTRISGHAMAGFQT